MANKNEYDWAIDRLQDMLDEVDQSFDYDALELAIKSIEAWESVKNELKEYGSLWVSYTVKAHTEKAIEDIVDDVLKQAKEQFIEIIDKHLSEVNE